LRRRLLLVAVAAALVSVPASSATVLPGFRSPSGNIMCLSLPGPPAFLWCNIEKSNYSKKLIAYCAQPRIGVDWVGFTLGVRSKGGIECSGGALYDSGTQHPHVVTLPYGKTWHGGAFACLSRSVGVTCHNKAGHGLFVSRQSYRVF
jgi:hypothetical protein